jgi:hypothetical protein
MGILIPRQLTKEQYIKLFSNPVPAIACEMETITWNQSDSLKDIRYSKSMMVRALDFWFNQLHSYCMKVWAIPHPLINAVGYIMDELKELGEVLYMVREELPDSFLFSHRYIRPGSFKDFSDDTQCKLLKNKYPMIKDYPLHYQQTKHDPYFKIDMNTLGIGFTVFPNEHPYIQKQKITKVGMTDKGNVYVLHKKEDVGAYTPTTTKDTVQAPKKCENHSSRKAISLVQYDSGDIKEYYYCGDCTHEILNNESPLRLVWLNEDIKK